MGSAYNSESLFHSTILILTQHLCSWQVDQLQVTSMVNHEVFRLDVTADDSFLGKVLKNENNGGSVELTVLSRKKSYRFEDVIELSTIDVLSKVEEIVRTLEFSAH